MNGKYRVLFLKKMFLKLTDSEHYLSMSMIIANLTQNGFSAGKRTIKEDIDVLVHMGYDIEYIYNKGYHLRSRPFSLSILKVLADAIACFRFLTVDDSETEVQEINETNEAGIGLKSVIRTPYELTVNELYEEGSNSDCFMVALDANGNKLPYNESNGNCNNFAIQDRDISTVDIYILDYVQYMDELKGEENYNNNEKKPEGEKWSDLLDQHAKYHKTLHFNQIK